MKIDDKHKLIIKLDNDISIYANKHEYIVKFQGENWYLPDLPICFQEIFGVKVRHKLIESQAKGMKEVIEIIKNTKKEIQDYFKECRSEFKD